jgi:SSS family solute:Na+ symporter
MVLLYFFLIIVIGLWTAKRIKNESDFLVGGRSMGKILQIFLNFGTATTAESAIGTSRETFRQGFPGIWALYTNLFATPIFWLTTIWQRRFRIHSMSEFYRLRYESKAMERVFSIYGIILMIIIIAMGMIVLEKTIAVLVPKSDQSLTIEERQIIRNFDRYAALKNKMTSQTLTTEEYSEYQKLEALKSKGEVKSVIPAFNSTVFMLAMSLILVAYTMAGGVIAAAITDLFQGIILIFLSILILPFGLSEIGWFSGLHATLPASKFTLFGSNILSEYPWYFMICWLIIGILLNETIPVNIQIMGSARDEEVARVSRVTGLLIKRILTVFWAFTGLVGFALYGSQISDPDMVWGYMSKQLLGPGLIGLMAVCLLAAFQSTSSACLVSLSALFTKSLYKPLTREKNGKNNILVERIAIGAGLLFSILFALYFRDFLLIFKWFLSMGLVFGPVFFLGIFWRKCSVKAAWTSIIFSAIFIVFLGNFGDSITPLARIEFLTQRTKPKVVVIKDGAVREDVDAGRATHVGEPIEKEITYPSTGIFFEKVVRENPTDPNSPFIGKTRMRTMLLVPALLGFDLSNLKKADLNALGYYLDIFMPFLMLIVISLFEKQNSEEALNEFYARMHTPAMGTPEEEERELELTRKNPSRFNHKKLFPNTSIEILKPTKRDVLGFLIICGIILIIITFIITLTKIGT